MDSSPFRRRTGNAGLVAALRRRKTMMTNTYRDRHDAGRKLASFLTGYAGRDDVVVLGLPRGGVPVAFEVARALRVSFDILLVRKLGVPGFDELAMGAIASGGFRFLNDDVLRHYRISPATVDAVAFREQVELHRREERYRGSRPPVPLAGRTVILVDDGLATGATMQTAIDAVRAAAARIVVAVPVASSDICAWLRRRADEVVCAATPEPFVAVGRWYGEFEQTTDQEVLALLQEVDHDVPRADETGNQSGGTLR